MSNNCINVDELTEVSETLLLTLYMRSLETKRKKSIIKDAKAVEIVDKIDYDFSLHDSELNQAVIAIRAATIDRLTDKILTCHPQITVVNLGAGLCTRFFRLAHERVNWINIDLPQVQPVWDSAIGASARLHFWAYSILDFEWIERLKAINPNQILFIAEGVLMFFTEAEVKQLINLIQANFGGSSMIFDSLGLLLAQNSRLNSGDLGFEAAYKWGIKDLKTIETWNSSIKLIDRCYYLDNHKNRLGLLGLFSYLPILRRQVKIGHIRLLAEVK